MFNDPKSITSFFNRCDLKGRKTSKPADWVNGEKVSPSAYITAYVDSQLTGRLQRALAALPLWQEMTRRPMPRERLTMMWMPLLRRPPLPQYLQNASVVDHRRRTQRPRVSGAALQSPRPKQRDPRALLAQLEEERNRLPTVLQNLRPRGGARARRRALLREEVEVRRGFRTK